MSSSSDPFAPRHRPEPVRAAHGSDTDLEPLVGVRVGVVGVGDLLARTLGTLHRLGAQCAVLEDPYHAVSELSRRPGAFGAVVLIAPCLYPEEVSAIPAMRACSPAIKVVLASAEQHLSLLAAALRAGCVGVLTDAGVEVMNRPAPVEVPAPSSRQDLPPGPTRAAEPVRPVAPVRPPEPALPERLLLDEEPLPADTTDAHHPADPTDDADDPFELPTHEPLITAEELHALLRDDSDPIRPSQQRTIRPAG